MWKSQSGEYGGGSTAYSWLVYNALWEGGVGKVRAPSLSKTYLDPGPLPSSLRLQQAMQMIHVFPGLCLPGHLSVPVPIGSAEPGVFRAGRPHEAAQSHTWAEKESSPEAEGTGPTAAVEELPRVWRQGGGAGDLQGCSWGEKPSTPLGSINTPHQRHLRDGALLFSLRYILSIR